MASDSEIYNKKYIDENLYNKEQIDQDIYKKEYIDENLYKKTDTYNKTEVNEISLRCIVITLTASEWSLNEGTGNYEYNVVDKLVTENHLVLGHMDLENQAKFKDGYVESYNGGYKIITSKAPESDVTMNMSIQKVGNQ